MSSRVSIALCTYNGEAFIEQQLQSLASQTRPPDEIVVRDDLSTDRTIEILHKFKRESGITMRITINSERLRVVKNFERAILDCTGDVIFICDQDDLWYADKISFYMNIFENRDDVVMVVGNSRLTGLSADSAPQTVWKNERFDHRSFMQAKNQFLKALNHSPFSGHATAIRRSLVEHIAPIPESWYYDQWIGKLAGAFGRIELIVPPLTDYRQHSNQQLGSTSNSLVKLVTSSTNNSLSYFAFEQQKLTLMLERLEAANATENCSLESEIQTLKKKIEFLQTREHIRKQGANRFLLIAKHLLNRNYFVFARGILTAGRDILD
jgi:glycosyltransferase involved in cell wall biosynthesis